MDNHIQKRCRIIITKTSLIQIAWVTIVSNVIALQQRLIILVFIGLPTSISKMAYIALRPIHACPLNVARNVLKIISVVTVHHLYFAVWFWCWHARPHCYRVIVIILIHETNFEPKWVQGSHCSRKILDFVFKAPDACVKIWVVRQRLTMTRRRLPANAFYFTRSV